MRSFVIFSVLVITSLIVMASFANAKDSKTPKSFLIGINGSEEIGNFVSFEDDLIAFRKLFGEQKTTLLNSVGPDTMVTEIESQDGLIERAFNGDPIIAKTKLRSEKAATIANMTQTIKGVMAKKPASVTVLFADHGAESGFSLPERILAYEEIQRIDDVFPADTVVRRIHLHCYSGVAIHRDRTGREVKNVSDLLLKYPNNRCALSEADESHFSTATNFTQYLKNHKNATLAQLAAHIRYSKLEGTPYLTSEYFQKDLTKLWCSSPQNCSQERSLENLNKTKESLLKRFCDTGKTIQEYSFSDDRLHYFARRRASCSSSVHANLVQRYLNEKFPNETQAFNEYQTYLKESFVKGGQVKPFDENKKKLVQEYVQWFTELQNERVADKWDIERVKQSLPTSCSSLEQCDESFKREWKRFQGETQARLVSEKYKDFEPFAIATLNKDTSSPSFSSDSEFSVCQQQMNAGAKRLGYRNVINFLLWDEYNMSVVSAAWQRARHEKMKDAFIEILELPENKLVKKRYDNIRNCEQSNIVE